MDSKFFVAYTLNFIQILSSPLSYSTFLSVNQERSSSQRHQSKKLIKKLYWEPGLHDWRSWRPGGASMMLKQGKKVTILVAPLLQILSQLQLLLHDLLIHRKTISLLPQLIKKSSHRGRDQRSRPPKSQSQKNRGLLSPQNLPISKATKRTLARSPYLFLPTLLSEIRKGGTTSTRN